MKRTLLTVVLSFMAALPAVASNLVGVDFSALPDERVEMRFTFDGDAPEPKVFAIESPARLAIDLDGVESLLDKKKYQLGLGDVQSTIVLTSGGRTRVIVNMTQLGVYDTEVKGNEMIVTVGDEGRAMNAAVAAAAAKKIASGVTPGKSIKNAATGQQIESVDFRRGEEGEGRLIIELSSPYIEVNSEQKGEAIELTFEDTKLPKELQLKYDVADFATPIKYIDATGGDKNTLIKVVPTGEYEYLAYQSGDTYVLTVKPLTQEQIEAKKKEFSFVGDKLSLNFQDIEIRSVLQLIADFTDLNLVASDTVNGKITLRLQNVPWDQALDLILKTKGLDKRQEGNVLLVAPAAEIAQREQQAIQTNKQLEELAPLQTEFIRIRYAAADDIAKMLDGTGDQGGRILTERAMVVVDERTNSLLVTETGAKLAAIRRLINLIDVPVRQVMIEARIVVATASASESLGIQWGGFLGDRNDERVIVAAGSDESIIDINNGDTVEFGNVVDLGVQDFGATNFNIGLITDSGIINLELSAIETAGDGEVLSQPKIITGDKQNAVIRSGTEIAYETTAPNGGTTIAFKDAVLELDVTPSITPDNRVIMTLNIKQDSPGTETSNGIPTIDTNELNTQVLVNNGETIVLGGVFSSQETESVTKTPFLGDIPYLGRLFKRTTKSSQKTELLIFVTPKILADQLVQ